MGASATPTWLADWVPRLCTAKLSAEVRIGRSGACENERCRGLGFAAPVIRVLRSPLGLR